MLRLTIKYSFSHAPLMAGEWIRNTRGIYILEMRPELKEIKFPSEFVTWNKKVESWQPGPKPVFLLCKKEAAWINGAVIPVDGGEHIS